MVTEDRGVVKESDTESETVESIGVAGSPGEEEMEVGASRVIEEKKVKGKTKHKGKGRHKGKTNALAHTHTRTHTHTHTPYYIIMAAVT